MKKRKKNRAGAYLRRSREKQEASLEEQLDWAKSAAAKHHLSINLTQSELQKMIDRGECFRNNVYLDNGVTGSDLLRPGLVKLIEDTTNDQEYSHVFVLNRSRFARPHHPLDATILEHTLTSCGITLIFSDVIAEPGLRGSASIMQSFLALMQYSQSGEYLYQLAMNVLRGQIRNAKKGGWNGGDPPYGFERVLVNPQGEVVEWLEPKKSVHKEGCIIQVRPYYLDKIKTWIQILKWKSQGWGNKRIARKLNESGILSPDAGKIRTKNGVSYEVSGSWRHTTVGQLIKNAAIVALYVYGLRSTGGHSRIGINGPRELTDEERIDDQTSKVAKNSEDVQVRTPANYKPEFDVGEWAQIQQLNLYRSMNQRGIQRSKDPTKYALSCRLFDLTEGCGWTMNGFTVHKRKTYQCGRYHNSSGSECHHHVVDADGVLETVVANLKVKLRDFGNSNELRKLLIQKTRENAKKGNQAGAVALFASEIKLAEAKIARLTRRIADEDSNDEVYKLLKGELDRLLLEKRLKQEQLAQIKLQNAGNEQRSSPTEEVETALTVIEQLQEVVSTNKEAVQRFQDLLVSLDIRIGLNFGNKPVGKRILRNLLGGIIAIGGHPLPVPIYGRNNLNAQGRSRLLATNTTDGEASPPSDEGSATPSIVNPGQREDNLLPKVLHAGA